MPLTFKDENGAEITFVHKNFGIWHCYEQDKYSEKLLPICVIFSEPDATAEQLHSIYLKKQAKIA